LPIDVSANLGCNRHAIRISALQSCIQTDWHCRELREQQVWWRSDAHAAGRLSVRIEVSQFCPGMTLAIDQRKTEGLSRSIDRANAK